MDASLILHQNQKKREWKEHRPSGEYSTKKRRSTLQKVADLNNSDRIVATTTVMMPKDGTITASSVIEAIPADENQDPQSQLQSSHKRRKSADRNRPKITQLDSNDILISSAKVSFIFTSYHMMKNVKSLIYTRYTLQPSAPVPDTMTSGSDSEGIFKPSPNIGGYTLNTKSSRGHSFAAKTVIKPEVCSPCGKR